MKKKQLSICMLLLLVVLNASAKRIQVNVLNVSFSPKTFTAQIGDTINFVWVAGTHTTTSTSVPAGALAWNMPSDNTHRSFLYPLKVAGNYAYRCNFHFMMGMVGSFIVLPRAKIVILKATAVNSCSSTNSLQYKCTQSQPPYKVQLFRYGLAFGSSRTVPDTLPFTFSNLPVGSYSATAKGHNGTDSLTGGSATSPLAPIPINIRKAHITSTKATILWTHYTCVKFFTVQFRLKGTTTFTKINTIGNKDSLNLTGLTPNSRYEFQVASADSARKIIASSKFTPIDSFKTTASGLVELKSNVTTIDQEVSAESFTVYPNPAASAITVQIQNGRFVAAILRNTNGKIIWSELQPALLEKGKQLHINLQKIPAGTYFLQLTDADKKNMVKEVIVVK